MECVLGINEIPKRVAAFSDLFGGMTAEIHPDVHAVLFEYAGVPVYMRLSLGTETAE